MDRLERVLLDPSEEPTTLELSLLKNITFDFSDDVEIGRGGFAAVYKGVLQNGAVIAVKKLLDTVVMDEEIFTKEVACLMKAKHKNIVRFLGYCSDTQGKILNYEGKMIQAEERQRLLCFEFLPKGSLDKYITDVSGGLEWRTCYKIIKGICEGLHYLHENNIVHLDLKPPNILLNDDMVPKIADFGISRCFNEMQTRAATSKVYGTVGYMAPEFYNEVITITFKSDIYSLGTIIIEMLTGRKGHPDDIDNVIKNWSTRFGNVPGDPRLEHVKACVEMGIKCIDTNPVKRPTTWDIIDMLVAMDHTYGFKETDDLCTSWATHVLDVYPLEIWFPFESDKVIKCPVTLTNKTDNVVGVWIAPTSLDACSNLGYPYVWEPEYEKEDRKALLFRKLQPHSSKIIYMTMKKQEQPPLEAADKAMFDLVMIPKKSEKDLKLFDRYWNSTTWSLEDPLRGAKELGCMLHRVTLKAAVARDPAIRYQPEVVAAHQFIQDDGEFMRCMDMHPTEKWLLVACEAGNVSIWNCETQERTTFQVKYLKRGNSFHHIRSVKFIAGEKQWFAAGDNYGGVHVYAYISHAEEDKVTEFKAHRYMAVTCLAVHPKHTLLLTLTRESIKLWDWSQGWICTRVIDMHDDPQCRLTAGPKDTSIFASTNYSHVTKVWDIHSPDAIATFKGQRPTFYTKSQRDFLAILSSTNIEIWDLDTKKCVHKLCPVPSVYDLDNIAFHPTLPILASSIIFQYRSEKNPHILLWDVRRHRVLKRIELHMEGNRLKLLFNGTEDITRCSLVVASEKDISIIKINVPKLLTGC